MRIKILIIDDDKAICETLKNSLSEEGYDAECVYRVDDALTLDLSNYSLFFVAVMMERISGFDFLKMLRSSDATENTPVIFCSALDNEEEKVMGLNLGADDYITKPFSVREVCARVRAVLRRSHIAQQWAYNISRGTHEPDITFHDLRINRNEKMCYINGEQINLTKTEYDLLHFFLTHRNRIYSREEIIEHVWSRHSEITTRAIDTNITRLRKKIGEYGQTIVTRQGYGYGFNETY
jgi:two-component system phosphate regulon response regulator PhoB